MKRILFLLVLTVIFPISGTLNALPSLDPRERVEKLLPKELHPQEVVNRLEKEIAERQDQVNRLMHLASQAPDGNSPRAIRELIGEEAMNRRADVHEAVTERLNYEKQYRDALLEKTVTVLSEQDVFDDQRLDDLEKAVKVYRVTSDAILDWLEFIYAHSFVDDGWPDGFPAQPVHRLSDADAEMEISVGMQNRVLEHVQGEMYPLGSGPDDHFLMGLATLKIDPERKILVADVVDSKVRYHLLRDHSLHLQHCQMEMVPKLVHRGGHQVVELVARVTRIDVEGLPSHLDRLLANLINESVSQSPLVSQDVTDQLRFDFSLGSRSGDKVILQVAEAAAFLDPGKNTLTIQATVSAETVAKKKGELKLEKAVPSRAGLTHASPEKKGEQETAPSARAMEVAYDRMSFQVTRKVLVPNPEQGEYSAAIDAKRAEIANLRAQISQATSNQLGHQRNYDKVYLEYDGTPEVNTQHRGHLEGILKVQAELASRYHEEAKEKTQRIAELTTGIAELELKNAATKVERESFKQAALILKPGQEAEVVWVNGERVYRNLDEFRASLGLTDQDTLEPLS